LQKLSALAVKISALVHETQKERGMTAGFLGSKGKQFATDLTAQRKETDNKIKNLETFLTTFEEEDFGTAFKNTLNRALDNFRQLQGKRDAVRTLNIPLKEALAYYTNMNTSFLNVISDISKICTNAELSALLFAYVNFLQGKERAGIERAVLSNVFAANKFAPRMFNRFSSLVKAQDVYRSVFLAVATSEQKDFFQNKMKNPAAEEVTRMRKIAFEKALEGNFGVDAAYWFKTQTNKINLLKEVEDKLSDDLNRRSAQIKSKAQTALYFFIGITMVAFLSSIFLGLLVARSITRPLGKMADAALKLAVGDIEQSIEYKSDDEIGKLADSFREMIEDQKAKAVAAEEIARGMLAMEVKAVSDQDVLGRAMVTMKESISGLLDETNVLIGAIQDGKLDTRGNESAFTGSWGELVGGINKVIEAFVAPIKVTGEYVDRISKGDIPPPIADDYRGDFKKITDNLSECVDVMNNLLQETKQLIQEAKDGNLKTRGNASKFSGDWKEIIEGINQTLDTFIAPVQESALVLNTMAKGDFTGNVSGDYKGDHAIIKDSVNKTLSGLNSILGQVNVAVEQFSAGAEQVSQSSQAVS